MTWRSYLPLDCPVCDRRRLEYHTNDGGDVTAIRCEKCGCNTDDDTLNPTPSDFAGLQAAEWATYAPWQAELMAEIAAAPEGTQIIVHVPPQSGGSRA